MNTLLRSACYFRPDLPRIAVVLALLGASVGLNLLKPWPLAILVDSVLGPRALPQFLARVTPDSTGGLVLWLGVALCLIHAGQGMFAAAQQFLAIRVSLCGLMRVRNEVFACLQRLSIRFHQGARAGDMIYRASWDTYAFQTLFQQGLISFLTALLSLLLMIGVMWRLNGTLTLVALITVPFLFLSIRIFGRKMRERGLSAQQADSGVTAFVQQTIAALPLIQSFTREPVEISRFGQKTHDAQVKRAAQHGWELLYWLGVAVVFGLGTALTVWLGAQQVLAGRLTLGELLVFLAYLAQLYEPLNQLSHVGATVSTASAGAQRVFELLDTPLEIQDAPGARPVVPAGLAPDRAAPDALICRGRIEFRNVSFGYRPAEIVLRQISFEVPAGCAVAVVGSSGAGKSTLLHLLPRFFDPTAGAVLLDGSDLRGLRVADLRMQVAVVMQEPILLPGSLAENIAFGKPGATAAEIEAAAQAANAHELIQRLPQQYETRVGETGIQLSVGERQRISLARAFLKNAPILVLDEPTSALDNESEQLVVESLGELMRNRTTFIAAHRLTTIRKVDTVLVLENGRLAECGPPHELLSRNGYFARVAREVFS